MFSEKATKIWSYLPFSLDVTNVSFIPFFVFGFWSLWGMKLRKYYEIFVYILQGKVGKMEKNWKENHATKVTKRRKYGMNETLVKKL